MRRIATSLIATLAIASLAACSGGGYGIGTSSSTQPTAVAFNGSSGQVADFFVAPNGSAPVAIAAVGYTGSGATADVVPFAQFRWQAGYAASGTTFTKGPEPSGNTACGTPASRPATPVLQAGPGGNTFPLYNGAYSTLPTAQTASQVFVAPPLDASGQPVLPASGSTNYCLVVVALNAAGTSAVGSTIVVVTNAAP